MFPTHVFQTVFLEFFLAEELRIVGEKLQQETQRAKGQLSFPQQSLFYSFYTSVPLQKGCEMAY